MRIVPTQVFVIGGSFGRYLASV
ncbi:hypothetical protein [Pseudorhodoplanes sp.]